MKESLGIKDGLRTWIEVSRENIKKNLNEFRRIIPEETKLAGVVKSNAYGHSLVDFTREIEPFVDYLAVDSIIEGVRLRQEGIEKPIFVLGYTLTNNFSKAFENNISVTISTLGGLEKVIESAKGSFKGKLKIHIKVDTGMHRQGFAEADKENLFSLLENGVDNIEIEGVYSHFAAADESRFDLETKRQLDKFDAWKREFEDRGYKPLFHIANTPGAMYFPESHMDMVRIGIGLYGFYPSGRKPSYPVELKPILSWKTIVSEINDVPKGDALGYGFSHEFNRDSRVAICPIGYWHGYARNLSNKSHVLVRGERAPVVGRVSMDILAIDVTNIEGVEVGDEVVLIGKQGSKEVSADELAEILGTISYEVVTRVNPLIKKYFI